MSSDETPPYTRRRTEDMRSDELTNHRLSNLEEGVRQMTTSIAASHALLGDISARQQVGAERIAHYEVRIESLEGDRRWTVLGILAGFGALAWHAILTIIGHGKAPLILVAMLVLSGCAKDRAQIGSDARAGIEGAKMALDVGQVETAKAILAAVDQRLPATAEVNSAKWPAPKMTPEQVLADPEAYGKSAPPEPSMVGLWAAVGGALLATLGFLRVAAPFVPGLGPLWKTGIDLVYAVAQHSKAKQVDDAAERAREVLDAARAPLALVRTAMPSLYENLPPTARQALDAVIDCPGPPRS